MRNAYLLRRWLNRSIDRSSHRKVGKAGRDRHALVRCRPDSSRLLDIIMRGVVASGSGVQSSSALSSSSIHPMDGKASSPSQMVAKTAARSKVEEAETAADAEAAPAKKAEEDEAEEPLQLVAVRQVLFESNDPVLRRRLWGRSRASVAGVREIMEAEGAVACWLAHIGVVVVVC
jgi:hypothetical protein